MNKLRLRGVFVILAILFSTTTPHPTLAAPTIIDNATVATATSNTSQRKTFYDTLNDRHWAFYFNGVEVEYSYSADGQTWQSAGSLSDYTSPNFSIVFRVIAGTSYVVIAAEVDNHDVEILRGALSNNNIAFDPDTHTVYDGNNANDEFTMPSIAFNGSDQIWVAAVHYRGDNEYQAVVRRTTNDLLGDISLFENQTEVGGVNDALRNIVILPRTGDEMYLVTSTNGRSILGYAYDTIE